MSATLVPTPSNRVAPDKSRELHPYINETYRHSELAGLTQTFKLEPREQFRKQVYETWLPKWDEEIEGVSSKAWFQNAEHDGAVQLKEYTGAELRALRDLDQIH